jgi:hypothetical protein
MSRQPADEREAGRVSRLLSRVAELANEANRPDLERRAQLAAARLLRPAAVLAVVGEFKQGKSDLVNALVGRRVCPAHDDLATCAITVLHHAGTDTCRVRRMEGDAVVVESIDPSDVAAFASEAGNPDNERMVETVEIGFPVPFLERGLTLVDTPGVGGIEPGRTEALMAFLPVADAVLLVTDASAELSASEIGFLTEVRDLGVQVIVALTKIDLYPHWRRIRELDAAHLAGAGIGAEVSPVSAAVHLEGIDRGDPRLQEESGVLALADALAGRVAAGSAARAVDRALADVSVIGRQLGGPLRSELTALEDPALARGLVRDLEDARLRLSDLKRAGSRWAVLLQEGVNDIRSEAEFELRSRFRLLQEEVGALIEGIDPVGDWEEVAAVLREGLAAAAGDLVGRIRSEAAGVADRVADLLRDASAAAVPGAAISAFGPASGAAPAAPDVESAGAVGTGIEVLRGSYSGVLLLGFVARFVALPLLGPAALGVGAVFGVKQFGDLRKRRLAQRRVEANKSVKRYLDAAQLDLGRQVRHSIQDAHRELRDHFNDRIDELLQEQAAAVQVVQDVVAEGKHAREHRVPELTRLLVAVESVLAEAEADPV